MVGMTAAFFVFGGELCAKLCGIRKVYPEEKFLKKYWFIWIKTGLKDLIG